MKANVFRQIAFVKQKKGGAEIKARRMPAPLQEIFCITAPALSGCAKHVCDVGAKNFSPLLKRKRSMQEARRLGSQVAGFLSPSCGCFNPPDGFWKSKVWMKKFAQGNWKSCAGIKKSTRWIFKIQILDFFSQRVDFEIA